MNTIVVFVHGWSVTHTRTYGELPARLAAEASAAGMPIDAREIHLGRYISFHDEVRIEDIARAFRTAIDEQLGPLLAQGRRFVCITHSTGAPVVRTWWRRYHQGARAPACPMSHLLMLAPANHGSALAILGKGRLGRIKSWWSGVEPGRGVLEWLTLGSAAAWELNRDWIESQGRHVGPTRVFPFVLTGQSIDRAFYDNLNSYTGEAGSDGVVRVASASLQAGYLRLVQQAPVPLPGSRSGRFHAPELRVERELCALETPLRILSGKSHSGRRRGIMRSVRAELDAQPDRETIDALLRCLRVESLAQYRALTREFAAESEAVQASEQLEVARRRFPEPLDFLHDRYSMLIFRLSDHEGHAVPDFDLLLTAGEKDSPNHLPRGFFVDRQQNPDQLDTVCYYLNHSVLTGCAAIHDGERLVRPPIVGTSGLGLRIVARPDAGFAHYMECGIEASPEFLRSLIVPNRTTLVDIVLQRVVGSETFRLERGIAETNFVHQRPGDPLPD